MKKNDLIKTENGIYRILSIEANRVLAIDCISKTMPKFYPVSSFGNGEFIDCIPADFPDMEDLSPADRKITQERYTMIIYHIFPNNKQLRAVWIRDGFECYISGELTVDELEEMIDSIEKG